MRRLPPLRFLLVMGGTIAVLCWLSSLAQAASVKVCFKDVHQDATEVRAYVGTATQVGQLLPGQTQTDGSVCATLSPVPPPIIPGTTQSWTLRAANAVGQESAPSNALSFRYPTVPTAPTLLSVGASVP